MGQPSIYHATVALSFQIEICKLDRTKSSVLDSTSLYKKVIFTKNWVTMSCRPSDDMCVWSKITRPKLHAIPTGYCSIKPLDCSPLWTRGSTYEDNTNVDQAGGALAGYVANRSQPFPPPAVSVEHTCNLHVSFHPPSPIHDKLCCQWGSL